MRQKACLITRERFDVEKRNFTRGCRLTSSITRSYVTPWASSSRLENVTEYCISVRKAVPAGTLSNKSVTVWGELTIYDMKNVSSYSQVDLCAFQLVHQLVSFLFILSLFLKIYVFKLLTGSWKKIRRTLDLWMSLPDVRGSYCQLSSATSCRCSVMHADTVCCHKPYCSRGRPQKSWTDNIYPYWNG